MMDVSLPAKYEFPTPLTATTFPLVHKVAHIFPGLRSVEWFVLMMVHGLLLLLGLPRLTGPLMFLAIHACGYLVGTSLKLAVLHFDDSMILIMSPFVRIAFGISMPSFLAIARNSLTVLFSRSSGCFGSALSTLSIPS